jgi:hypothetical protein
MNDGLNFDGQSTSLTLASLVSHSRTNEPPSFEHESTHLNASRSPYSNRLGTGTAYQSSQAQARRLRWLSVPFPSHLIRVGTDDGFHSQSPTCPTRSTASLSAKVSSTA